MSYMKHYHAWLKKRKLLDHPKPMSFLERYWKENPDMVPPPPKEVGSDQSQSGLGASALKGHC